MTHRTERSHTRSHSQPEPGPNELYNMVRGLVGDAGTVVRPSRTPGRTSAAWALLPLAWLLLSILYLVGSARADATYQSIPSVPDSKPAADGPAQIQDRGAAKLTNPSYRIERVAA